MTTLPISPALFDFLRELKANNERPWFEANKARYLSEVRDPMLDFIAAFAEPLAEISPPFRADPAANGGSLFRIYRNRLLQEQTPYKTNRRPAFATPPVGTPRAGFYPPGAGAVSRLRLWHRTGRRSPDPGRHRRAGGEWRRITTAADYGTFELTRDPQRPRAYDPDHPLIDDSSASPSSRHALFRNRSSEPISPSASRLARTGAGSWPSGRAWAYV